MEKALALFKCRPSSNFAWKIFLFTNYLIIDSQMSCNKPYSLLLKVDAGPISLTLYAVEIWAIFKMTLAQTALI